MMWNIKLNFLMGRHDHKTGIQNASTKMFIHVQTWISFKLAHLGTKPAYLSYLNASLFKSVEDSTFTVTTIWT